MRFVGDERAQSIQVGAVLLFAILIIFLAVWQAVVIPNQNEQVEFDHNQEVQSQLEGLRADMAAMAGSSTIRSSSIDLGVRYPPRLVSLNPPAASGRIETVGTTDESVAAVIKNATATGETGDFWNGSEQWFNTGAIVYEPRYNEYAQPPDTVLENGVVFNEFSSGRTIPLTDQVVVDGDRIRIGALNGSLSLDRIDGASVDLQPVSTQTRTVAVREPDPSTPGGNVTIELPTRLDQADWEELVAGEQVHDVTVSGGTVTIEMENLFEGESYDLQLWKVGVGTGATPTETEYLTNVGETDRTVQQGQNVSLVVEARDRFNGPQRGTLINATGEIDPLDKQNVSTDSEGQAKFIFNTSEAGSGEFTVRLESDDSAPKQVNFTLTVQEERNAGNNGTDPVSGPNITADNESIAVTQGEEIRLGGVGDLNITGNVSSIGTEDRLRSGTPIQEIRYNISNDSSVFEGTYAEFNPDMSNLSFSFDKITNITERAREDFNTTDLAPGNYTLELFAQDASGRLTPEEDRESVNLTVEMQTETQADSVNRVESSTAIGGNTRPQFDFIADSEVRIIAAAIETVGNLSSVGADTNGQRSYFTIDSQESTQNQDDTNGNFVYEYNPGLLVDGEKNVEFNRLENQIENFRFTEQSELADIVIYLKFDDDSVKEFYFQANTR